VAGIGGTPQPGTGRLFARVGTSGTFTNVAMTQTAPNQYLASLPAAACGSTIQFYVTAQTTTGTTISSPSDAPTSLLSTVAATGLGTPFTDTVETNLGWTLTTTGDTATAGLWVRGDPVGTINGSVQVQPDNDVTAAPGVNCFFTGQGTVGGTLGAADVDGGFTTLTSPTMNATGGVAYVNYYRWYSNSQGGAPNADTFRVQISNNNGTTWVPLETVGPTGAETNGGWVFKEFRVSDFVTPTSQIRIRFIAEDVGTGSLVEAAVDEVRMRVLSCARPGDIDGNGAVDGGDLAALLSNWGGSGAADLDGNGTIDGGDLAVLLSNWG
jgi:aminopeptidase S